MSQEYKEEFETVEIVNVAGELGRINKADFDEKTMKRWEGSEEQKTAQKAKK